MVHRIKGSSRFYASVAVPGRRTLRVAGFPSRRLSENLERALENLTALRSVGQRPDRELQAYLDALPDRIKRRLVGLGLMDTDVASRWLEDVLGRTEKGAAPGEFERYLIAKGDSERHARQQARRARRVLIERCGFKRISDIAAEPVLRALADMRAGTSINGSEKVTPISASTSNQFRQACRSVTRWLTREGRIPADPLAYLERITTESESDRRALTAEEQGRLVAKARSEQRRQGLSGEARSMLYLLALHTGLRRGELLSLRRSNFDLGSEPATVMVEHGHTKNRKTARLPLQAQTAAAVRRFLADALPAAPVFRGATRHYRAAEILSKDLEAAGIPEVTEAGRVDFHALRVSFVTNLARAGVPLAQTQKLARHCDPKLTARIYSRFAPEEDVAAIAKLPMLAGEAV